MIINIDYLFQIVPLKFLRLERVPLNSFSLKPPAGKRVLEQL